MLSISEPIQFTLNCNTNKNEYVTEFWGFRRANFRKLKNQLLGLLNQIIQGFEPSGSMELSQRCEHYLKFVLQARAKTKSQQEKATDFSGGRNTSHRI